MEWSDKKGQGRNRHSAFEFCLLDNLLSLVDHQHFSEQHGIFVQLLCKPI